MKKVPTLKLHGQSKQDLFEKQYGKKAATTTAISSESKKDDGDGDVDFSKLNNME